MNNTYKFKIYNIYTDKVVHFKSIRNVVAYLWGEDTKDIVLIIENINKPNKYGVVRMSKFSTSADISEIEELLNLEYYLDEIIDMDYKK